MKHNLKNTEHFTLQRNGVDIINLDEGGNSKIFYGTCNSAANSTEKAVSCSEFTANSLVDGVMVIVKFSNTNSGAVASLTLNVNETGAFSIKKVYATSTSNAGLKDLSQVAEISADSVIPFIFNGTYWVVAGVDINYTYTINYSIDAGKYKAGVGNHAVSRYSLLMQKIDGTWEKITNTSDNYSVNTNKTVNTNGFLLNQIVYHSSKTEFGTGELLAANTCYRKSASLDLRYSTNCGNSPSWSIGDYIYLVGTLHSDGLFYLDATTWWTNTLPSTNDGKLYIRLGLVLDTLYTISFFDERPIFYHNGTRLCEYLVADNKQGLLIPGDGIEIDENNNISLSGVVMYDDEISVIPDIDTTDVVPRDLSYYDVQGRLQNTRETANCYVISKTGYYRLPLVYGNGIVDDETNSSAYTNNNGAYQSDFVNFLGNTISSPYIEEDTGVNAVSAGIEISDTDDIIDKIEIKSYPDENCRFLQFRVKQVPSTGANAVISIHNSSVMWSWHIWLWKESLRPVTIENNSGNEYDILPVNLGSKYDEDGVHLKNWFYQWGRKDPMLLPSGYNKNSNHQSFGEFGETAFSIVNRPAVSVAEAIKNPCTFYTFDTVNYNYNYNWVELNYFYNFWDATCNSTGWTEKDIVKTIYDPCPRGYCVPNARVFTGFTTTGNNTGDPSEFNVNGSWVNGWNFKTAVGGSVFFPASGARYGSYGPLGGVGGSGGCWSAGAAGEDYASLLYFSSGYVDPLDGINRSYGFSVRPAAI